MSSTPQQAEHDNQQPVGDDTCGERNVAMFLEMAGVDLVHDAPSGKAFVDRAWADVVDADAPGTPESQRGTTLAELYRVIVDGATWAGIPVPPISWIETQDEFLACLRLGLWVIVGVHLVDLLPLPELGGSNHFLGFYALSSDQNMATAVDPAHDIDGAWLLSQDRYSLAAIMRGARDLFPAGAFGLAFKYVKPEVSMPDQPQDPPMSEPEQTAAIKMEARQGQLLTDVIQAFRTGKFEDMDTIYCALKDIQQPDYTPTYPR